MQRILRFLSLATLLSSFAIPASAQLVANFGASDTMGCTPITIQFYDSTTGGTPTYYLWDITGPGGFSVQAVNIQSPSYTFTVPGNYNVSLTVANGTDTSTKSVSNYLILGSAPVVNFVVNDSTSKCAPDTVQFTSTLTANSGGTAQYFWDFGDGTTSTLANPSHIYQPGISGCMNVTLTVTNGAGCVTTVTKNCYFEILAPPVVNFTSVNNIACGLPATVTFTNNPQTGVNYSWNFGDGGGFVTINTATVSHLYTVAGAHTVTLAATTSGGGCTDTIVKPNFVYVGQLVAGFSSSNDSACSGSPLTFTDTSSNVTGGAISNNWYADGSATPFATNSATATYTFATPGNHTISLVEMASNCTDTATNSFYVPAAPNIAFTASGNYNCTAPYTVTFTNSTTGAPAGSFYIWDFDGGGPDDTTYNTAANTFTYNTPGSYTPTLSVLTPLLCSTSQSLAAPIVIGAPSVTITSTLDSGCSPLTTCFTATPVAGAITGNTWDFGDPSSGSNTSTASNPCHTYTSPTNATYTVTLNYSIGMGCTGTATKTIKVGTPPNASLVKASPAGDTFCVGTQVCFTNTTPPGTFTGVKYYYQAQVNGSGQITALGSATNNTGCYTYNALGTFYVVMVVYNNGCTDTAVAPDAVVIKGAVANFTSSYNCGNRLDYTFNSTTTGLSGGSLLTWSFGDPGSASNAAAGTPVTHTFTGYTTFPVTLTVYDSVDDCTSTKTINITPTQIFSTFTVNNATACVGGSISVTATPNPANVTYKWFWGDGTTTTVTGVNGSTTHVYDSVACYQIKLVVTDAKGCKDSTISAPNVVCIQGPVFNFSATPTNGCSPQPVSFAGTVGTTSSAITSSTYSFGDNTSGPGLSATHTYNTGVYTVTLTAMDNNGCMDSVKKTDYINIQPIPIASFYSNDTGVCPGQAVNFVNNSGTGLTYLWTFGDPGSGTADTSTLANPVHTYATPGYYSDTLIVMNANGCRDTLIRSNYIHVYNIQAAFTMSDSIASCPPLTVNFFNQSQFANQYLWTFGNGNSASIPNPSTTYTTAGTFTVKLVAISTLGCRDSVTHNVVVGGPTGSFSYSPLTGCAPAAVTFVVSNTTATVFTFDPRDFNTTTTNNSTFVYTYTQPGVYVPVVTLSDGASCSYALVGTDTIRIDRPNAGFYHSPDSICQFNAITFHDTSSGFLNPVVDRKWYFNYGVVNSPDTSHAVNPSFTYLAGGLHTVLLVEFTAAGCTDSAFQTIYILPNPVISISPAAPAVCTGACVQLTVFGAGGATGGYQWTPGNTLSSDTIYNPNACPLTTTTYTVIATAVNGCADTAVTTVVVNPVPVITITGDTAICNGTNTVLIAGGANTPAGPGMYAWSGPAIIGSASSQSVTVAPASTATYTVTGTTDAGCSGTASVTVVVTPQPTIIAPDPGPICRGDTAQLYANDGDTNVNTIFTWTPANPGLISCSVCDSPLVYPTVTTDFYVNAVANGCSSSDTVHVLVYQLPNVYAGPDVEICVGDSTLLTASGALTYFWTPSPVSSPDSASTFVMPPVTTIYTVTGTDIHGCINKDQVTVNVVQHVTTSVGPDEIICHGDSIQLNGYGGQTYVWSPAVSLTDPNIPDPIAFPDTTTHYTVFIRENQCFVDTFTVLVTVNPRPGVDLGKDIIIYGGESVQLNGNYTDATTYAWKPYESLSCADCPYPIASPTATTTYVVVVGNQYGCFNSDTLTVFVKCDSMIYMPNTFTPNGDGANDLFYPRARGAVTIKMFRIFNRWGEVVFERESVLANDVNYGWDGTFRGIPLKPDVYIYTIDFICQDGTAQHKQGDISLIR